MKLVKMTLGEWMEQYRNEYMEEELVDFPISDLNFLENECDIDKMAIISVDGIDRLFEIK